MSQLSHFKLLAKYNLWMNKKIYETADTLPEPVLEKDRGAFFGSIIATLNHILVGDTIWLKRFSNHSTPLPSLEYMKCIEYPKALNQVIHPHFNDLMQARYKMDRLIEEFASELTHDMLNATLAYQSTTGAHFNKNFGHLVQHFFNHQTHHRGQVSALLYQAGVNIGDTDLLLLIPEQSPI
ncbi:diguanylate cyclase [Pseudoalteromonas luteoviolacea]|uniref:Diguanylate cyclase n=1 Tax=Pseudoalteromonas luteoviolacea TaxID=43657 RepID=A0A1C0TSL1_9GAMM|nr:DinB family protein [Pseudoalteromonas luteoviolacea]OCQ22252.1 diguanylate cyclase [Pseudoalteromonas luteoviolacea]